MSEKEALAPMRRCFNCGEELGRYREHYPLDTCGKPECEREARSAQMQEREEAHYQLDQDRGWGGW